MGLCSQRNQTIIRAKKDVAAKPTSSSGGKAKKKVHIFSNTGDKECELKLISSDIEAVLGDTSISMAIRQEK
ncbi:hypothetical protein BGZ95_007376 [Linnemannia exigua]|uniref:Uncharacterized protein n=1 Tax=Linnemannia exigua TaxID=604196 RepID=A0AAD4D065_9FUNG|nr:hypothetical protein BGZ95_007376 [Linnemannia exigua]